MGCLETLIKVQQKDTTESITHSGHTMFSKGTQTGNACAKGEDHVGALATPDAVLRVDFIPLYHTISHRQVDGSVITDRPCNPNLSP